MAPSMPAAPGRRAKTLIIRRATRIDTRESLTSSCLASSGWGDMMAWPNNPTIRLLQPRLDVCFDQAAPYAVSQVGPDSR